MLTTSVGLAEKYDYLSERFKTAFAFLKDDAHKPRYAAPLPAPVKKIVVKVKV